MTTPATPETGGQAINATLLDAPWVFSSHRFPEEGDTIKHDIRVATYSGRALIHHEWFPSDSYFAQNIRESEAILSAIARAPDLLRENEELREKVEELQLGLLAKEAAKDRLKAEKTEVTKERNIAIRERDTLRQEVEQMRHDATVLRDSHDLAVEALGKVQAALRVANTDLTAERAKVAELEKDKKTLLTHLTALLSKLTQYEPTCLQVEQGHRIEQELSCAALNAAKGAE